VVVLHFLQNRLISCLFGIPHITHMRSGVRVPSRPHSPKDRGVRRARSFFAKGKDFLERKSPAISNPYEKSERCTMALALFIWQLAFAFSFFCLYSNAD